MVVHIYRALLLIVTLLLPSLVIAQDDQSSCIKVLNDIKPSTGEIAAALQNTCDYPVYVFWCHDGKGDGACGSEQRFYNRGRKIEPDEQYFNKYNLPNDVKISMGACIGRNISFGANGIGSYSCLGNDAPVIQPSDHTEIGCNDGQKTPYKWRQKKVTDKVAIVRLTTANQHYWVNIKRAEYNAFIDDDAVPAVFKARICNEKIETTSTYTKLKNELIGKINEKSHDERAACLDELWPSEECTKILKSGNTNAGTGERQ
jgi:hypothetical protein